MLTLGVTTIAALGCSDRPCGGVTADAVYVEVVDATTNTPVDATVTATRDGEPVDVTCLVSGRGGGPCESWAVGLLADGTFEITVSADGYAGTMDTVVVARDDCGPLSETRRYALEPVAANYGTVEPARVEA